MSFLRQGVVAQNADGRLEYYRAAEGGGFRLADYPNVQAWLDRVAATPGYIPIDA